MKLEKNSLVAGLFLGVLSAALVLGTVAWLRTNEETPTASPGQPAAVSHSQHGAPASPAPGGASAALPGTVELSP